MQNIILAADILIANPNLPILFPKLKNIETTDTEFERIQKIVYYLTLIYHPKSEIYNLPEAEKYKLVTIYDDTVDLSTEEAAEYKDIILTALLTASERALLTLEKKLLELIKFIEDTTYTMDNVKLLNDAQIAMDKLTDTIKNIRTKLAIEEEVNSTSLLEDLYN